MKVLHVLQYSLPNLTGYAIRADGVLRAQQAHGLDVRALTGPSQTASGDVTEESIRGVRYLRTPPIVGHRPAGIRQWKRSRALAARLGEVVAAEKPDIIHVHSPMYNGYAALRVARRNRVPVVYEMRAIWEDAAADQGRFGPASLAYWLSRRLETHVLRSADAVVGICNGLRDEILARGVPASKVIVVGNGVDTEMLQPLERDRSLADSLGLTSGPVFGFIGSLFSYEGVEDLLDAVPAVVRATPSARFLILGGGEREAAVRERIARMPEAGSIVYRPRVPHDQVPAYYSVLDAVLCPRRRIRLTELVTPLKPLEAMAMGLGVIASDVGGHKELVQHERTGLLFPAGDITALAGALCRAASQPSLLRDLGRAGRQFVVEHRTWKKVTEPCLAVYRRLSRASAA